MQVLVSLISRQMTSLQERHADLFQPSLPERKVSAIERLGIGVVDKIFLTFDAEDMPAHNQLARSYQLLWKQDAVELLPGSYHRLQMPAARLANALYSSRQWLAMQGPVLSGSSLLSSAASRQQKAPSLQISGTGSRDCIPFVWEALSSSGAPQSWPMQPK